MLDANRTKCIVIIPVLNNFSYFINCRLILIRIFYHTWHEWKHIISHCCNNGTVHGQVEMIACKYCGGDVSQEDYVHMECVREMFSRGDNGKCTRCGKNDRLPKDSCCETCDTNTPYLDYPGPQ